MNNLVCNLSRIPIKISENPVFKTCIQYEENSELTFNESFLYTHYKQFKLNSLADIYGLKIPALKEHPVTDVFLPWYHTHPVTKYSDSAFIQSDDSSIELQFKKIIDLYNSIKEKGYVPEQYPNRQDGHITGYLLNYRKINRFYVTSGNHRVAVINAVLKDNVKYTAKFTKFDHLKPRDKRNCGFLDLADHPKVFSISNVTTWPAVSSGFLKVSEAAAIFEKYIFV